MVRLVAVGAENRRPDLAISVGTVKIHLHHVCDKLRLSGRQALLQLLREEMLSRRAATGARPSTENPRTASRSAAETQPRTRPRAPGPAAAAPPRGPTQIDHALHGTGAERIRDGCLGAGHCEAVVQVPQWWPDACACRHFGALPGLNVRANPSLSHVGTLRPP